MCANLNSPETYKATCVFIIKRTEEIGNHEVAGEYNIDEKCVHYWMHNK